MSQQPEAILVTHPTEPWDLVIKVQRTGSDPELTQAERLILALRAQVERLQSENATAVGQVRYLMLDQKAKAELIESLQAAGQVVAWLSIDSIGERYLTFSKPQDDDEHIALVAASPQPPAVATPSPAQASKCSMPEVCPDHCHEAYPAQADRVQLAATLRQVAGLYEVTRDQQSMLSHAAELLLFQQPEPAQAVDAVPYATLQEADRFFSGRLAELGSLSGEATDLHACVRAALQASRQTATQQGGGDLSIYKARWCFALVESDDWTYAVCKWDGADWLPIKTEDDLRIFDAALATKEPRS